MTRRSPALVVLALAVAAGAAARLARRRSSASGAGSGHRVGMPTTPTPRSNQVPAHLVAEADQLEAGQAEHGQYIDALFEAANAGEIVYTGPDPFADEDDAE